MVAAGDRLPRLTSEEYFTWEQQQEVKHEYFDGEVFAMSGGKWEVTSLEILSSWRVSI